MDMPLHSSQGSHSQSPQHPQTVLQFAHLSPAYWVAFTLWAAIPAAIGVMIRADAFSIYSFTSSVNKLCIKHLPYASHWPQKNCFKQEKKNGNVWISMCQSANETHDIPYLFILALLNLNATYPGNCYWLWKWISSWLQRKSGLTWISILRGPENMVSVLPFKLYSAIARACGLCLPSGPCGTFQPSKPLYMHLPLFLILFTVTHS